MKTTSAVKSGAVATESDQFAQVRGVTSQRLYGPGATHWGSASFGLGFAFLHMPEGAAETVRVKLGRVEFKT